MSPRPETGRPANVTSGSSKPTEAQTSPSKKTSYPPAPALKRKKTPRSVSFALPTLPFPLASFLHPLRSASTQWLVIPAILMVAFLFRWAVGLGPFSGSLVPLSPIGTLGLMVLALAQLIFFRSSSTTNARGL